MAIEPTRETTAGAGPKTLARNARLAGWLYLASSIVGPFAFIYVPQQVLVRADPAMTAERLIQLQSTVRLGVAAALGSAILLIVAAVALYRLLAPVSRAASLLMVVFVSAAAPLVFIGALAQVLALRLVAGAGYAAVFPSAERFGLGFMLLDADRLAIVLAQVFWGLWLLPMGWMVWRAGFLPRLFGPLLMLAGAGYVAASFAAVAAPSLAMATGDASVLVGGLVETGFILWLIVMGARRTPRTDRELGSKG